MVRKLFFVLSILLTLTFLSCGGGPTSVSGPVEVSGVASMGAPMTSATVTIKSLGNGASYSPGVTDASGSFSFSVSSTDYPSPYLIRVTSAVGGQTASQFSLIGTGEGRGLVVSPLSSAALALAANRTADQAFSEGVAVSKADFDSKVSILFKVAESIFSSLGITNSATLVKNSQYQANGSGADSFFDIVKINYDGTLSGNLVLTTKFSGKAVELNNLTTSDSVGVLESIGGLASKIVAGINSNNSCIESAFEGNNSVSLSECLDSSFKDAEITNSEGLLQKWVSIAGKALESKATSVEWCDFDTASLSFASEANLLAGESGVCAATHEIKTDSSSVAFSGRYKFIVNSTGDDVSLVKLYGNQVATQIAVYPHLQKKVRIDGLTENTGITSGYQFDVGTGVGAVNASDQADIVSARVRLQNNSGSSITDGTFYMQCRQGAIASCTDSYLSICASSNCSSFNMVADRVFSVSASLAQAIISEMKSGRVRAEITTYSDTNRTTQVYQTNVALVGVPVAQNIANGLIFPSLDSTSTASVASWVSDTQLSVAYSAGSANLFQGVFYVRNGGDSDSSEATLISGTATHNSPNISNVSGLAGDCSSSGAYRSYTLNGSFNDVSTEVKYFGSCKSSDY